MADDLPSTLPMYALFPRLGHRPSNLKRNSLILSWELLISSGPWPRSSDTEDLITTLNRNIHHVNQGVFGWTTLGKSRDRRQSILLLARATWRRRLSVKLPWSNEIPLSKLRQGVSRRRPNRRSEIHHLVAREIHPCLRFGSRNDNSRASPVLLLPHFGTNLY